VLSSIYADTKVKKMDLEVLQKIQMVDPPAGLEARIQGKICLRNKLTTVKWIWGYGIACCAILLLDFSIVISNKIVQEQEYSGMETPKFYSDNQLYNR
jgi:hypothetical protein